jgi:outer membrane biosynthesis protein TonB
MAVLANLTREERVGLGIAVVAHIALVGGLMLQPGDRTAMPIPERMTVSLADDVSLQSTSPNPAAEAAAAVAPVLAPEPEPVPEPAPEPQPRAIERPVPQPVPPPQPRAQQPKPQPPRVQPTPQPRAAQPRPQPTQAAAKPRTGGSRIGDDFLKGTSDGDRANDRGSVAAAFGPAEAASLNSAIARQIKPHWSAPSGVDAEELVTMVRFRLNRNGTLASDPECVSQSGVTPSNSAQKGLHCERAIRAVRLAAPFDLPDQFYDRWKLITSRFDRRL